MTAQSHGLRITNGWPSHVQATLKLGLPLIGIHLAQMAITTTDTIMIGWLGAVPLAAGVLGAHSFFLLLMLGSGFAHAIMPIAAHAQGRGDPVQVRRAVRMGLWIEIAFCLLCMVPLWYLEPILLMAGQEERVADLAGRYIRILQWSLFPAMLAFVLRSFLVALERPQLMLWNTLASAMLNALLNYALIFGHWGAPALGIEGAAVASLVTTGLNFAVVITYSTLNRHFRPYTILVRIWRPDWSAMTEVLRLGWPISLTVIAEVGLFTASSVMMGWLGTVQLAAHGIALQLSSIAFMVPLGLGGVATVRVGLAFGRGEFDHLQRAAWTVIVLAAIAGMVSAGLFWLTPRPLANLFLDRANPEAAEVLAYAVTFLAIAAAFQLFDNMQAVSSGLLRGLKDTRTPMLIAVFSYWILGLPAAYLFAFTLGFGGWGIWVGLAFGLAAAAILLLGRFFRMAPSQKSRTEM